MVKPVYFETQDYGDGNFFIVAYERGGDRQVGCLNVNVNSPAEALGCKLAAIRWIGVTPSRRGEGLATRMYERAARLAEKHGRSLASDTKFLKAGRGFWEKQERLGRAKKVGKRWVLTCKHTKKLRNPQERGETFDTFLRRLEREAAGGDVLAGEELQRELARRGLGQVGPPPEERLYLEDLVRDMQSGTTRDMPRKVYAAGVRAVLKAIKIPPKLVSVNVPDYAWASHVEIRGPARFDRVLAVKGKRRIGYQHLLPHLSAAIGGAFGLWRQGGGWGSLDTIPPHKYSLYVYNTAGLPPPRWPSLPQSLWEVFRAGVRRGLEGKRSNPCSSGGGLR